MRIAFLHGWAGDHRIWDLLVAELAEFECLRDDRGYFGEPRTVEAADLVVTHSFGTMRALAATPTGCKAIVAINGFDCFAARADFPEGIAPRVIERMLSALERDPLAMVTEFRARCGALPPDRPPVAARLREDLERLRRDDCRGRWSGPLVLIHGADDPIVPSELQATTFADRADAARIVLPGEGHLVPVTAAISCAAAIRSALAGLR